jgi:putative flavoprotein involved in K+ transport
MTVNDVTQLIEEGAMASQMMEGASFGAISSRQSFDVIVIGAGQAGLSVGYHIARSGARFLILDANERVGDSWRNRWDSLRLFTPAKFDGLDGMPFPAPRNYFPTKDEMANYLEAYARHFRLPVRGGVRVERLFRRGSRYIIKAGTLELEAGQVVVAMAKYQHAKVPPLPPTFRAISSSCTRVTIATFGNFGRAGYSWQALGTRGQTSLWRSAAAVTRPAWQAVTPARFRFARSVS